MDDGVRGIDLPDRQPNRDDFLIVNPPASSTDDSGKSTIADALELATKDDVDLGNVDNTSDADKPISTATQTALNSKPDTSSLGELSYKDKAEIADIEATGTPSSTNYLRGDGTWGVPSGGGEGATGPQGPIGATGATGATGPQGASGADGATGATGPQGATGPGGASTWGSISGDISDQTDLQTELEEKANLSDVPAQFNPIEGSNITLSGTYPDITFSSSGGGGQGATGPQGPSGPPGATGPQGEPGADGTDGADGLPGATGPEGIQGATGPTGQNGQNGATGATGTQGATGPAGDPASNLVTSVNTMQGDVVIDKASVGLSNVDNTSDLNKPVSVAQQLALDNKAPISMMGPISGQEGTLDTFLRVPDRINASRYYGKIGKKLVIPTPDPNEADGEAVHPSVIYAPDGWNGYKYWMAMTPYKGGNDAYEDPCILVSNNGDDWIVPPGLTNPLDDAPGGTNYNSDTYLAWGPNNVMFLFWRNYNTGDVGNEEKIFCRTSTNGITWTTRQLVYSAANNVRRLFSPSFIYENGSWKMWFVNGVPNPNTVQYTTATNITGPWSTPINTNMSARSGKDLWHLWVGRSGSQYIALVNDTLLDQTGARDGDLLFATSDNGTSWNISPNPCIPRVGPNHTDLYFGCAIQSIVDGVAGFDVWYSARITASPSVWSILRTNLNTFPPEISSSARSASGLIGGNPQVNSNGGSVDVSVSFPSGLFTTANNIGFSCIASNARLNPSLASINTNGAVIRLFNWTSANAGSGWAIRWIALETSS